MRKRLFAAGMSAVALIGATALPAAAIRYGEPDNGEHPYVGLMVAYTYTDADGDGQTDDLTASWRCTGTQMDPDTFMTAGHCTYGADAVAIWYDEDLRATRADRTYRLYEDAISADNPYRADAWASTSSQVISHPEYDDNSFFLHDVGVVQLDRPVSLPEYGELPEQGYWDTQLEANKPDRDSYTTVGYGLQRSLPDKGTKQQTEDAWLKLKAHGELIGGDQMFNGGREGNYVVLTSNAKTGGTCSGDSGGPTFISGTNTVVGVTSFGVNSTCSGTSGIYRIDQPDDLAWLSQYID